MTHRTPFTPAFRLVEMLDVATDTTVESTMIMKNPTRTAQSARQALRSESKALNCLNSLLTAPPRTTAIPRATATAIAFSHVTYVHG